MSGLRLFFVVAIAIGVGAAAARGQGGHSNWGDFGVEAKVGSYEIGIQKRLSQGGLQEWKCRACAHYVEAWFEDEDADVDGRDRDLTALGLGYRYYFLTGDENPNRRESLAAFVRLGLSRIELEDPDTTRSGYYVGLGLQYPITTSSYREGPRAGTLRPFWVSVIATGTHNEIETDLANPDYFSAKIGLRLVFPSRRDKRRGECLNLRVTQIKERLSQDQTVALSQIDRTDDFAAAVEAHEARLGLALPSACHEPGAEPRNEP